VAEALVISIKVDVEAVVQRFGKLASEKLVEAHSKGLSEGLDYAANEVVMAADPSVHSRTGTLLGSVVGRLDAKGAASGAVGVFDDSPAIRYAYLLTDEVKTILPVEAQALTIPLPANLTPAGDPIYKSVDALKAAFPAQVYRRGRAIGIGDDEEFQAYFALAGSVTVAGWNVLEPTVEQCRDEIAAAVQRQQDELVKATE